MLHMVKQTLLWLLIVLLGMPPGVWGQEAGQAPVFKQEELDQILAPIALYPDSLIAQILMASTYPLEVVQAERFAKQNASLKGEALTKALEAQSWDPSVKSLVNFPQVLTMMSEKLDWTQKLGDAFLAQQKPVMDTIQSLRAKAQAAGNLKTTKEQTVIVEEKIIKIEPASPQVIYVPTYNPTVVYGAWPYPAYPPYSYYPPGYVAASMFAFGAGVAMGAAWGYAWGNTNWNGGDVDIDVNRNTNINNNINRSNYSRTGQANGQGNWQHNAEHRKGVAYRDQGTAQKFNRASTSTRSSRGRIFAAAPKTAGRIWRAAARAIAQEQVIAAAPANAAAATDRQQRIVVAQVSVVGRSRRSWRSGSRRSWKSRRRKPTRRRWEQIEADWKRRRRLSRRRARRKSGRSASQRGSASRGGGGGGGAKTAVAAGEAAVAVADGAGKKSAERDCRVKIAARHPTHDPRHCYIFMEEEMKLRNRANENLLVASNSSSSPRVFMTIFGFTHLSRMRQRSKKVLPPPKRRSKQPSPRPRTTTTKSFWRSSGPAQRFDLFGRSGGRQTTARAVSCSL